MEAHEIKDVKSIMTKDEKEIHAEAVTRMDIVISAEKIERENGTEESLFANVRGAQWEDFVIENRGGRPKYELNYVGKGIDILIGDQRQTEVGPKITPAGHGATDDTAKVMRGMIRNIAQISRAQNAYDQACDETYCSRFGGWRIVTKYSTDDTFEQDIEIESVDSAVTSMFFDPSANKYDRSDAMWAFMITRVHRKDYNAMYPDSMPSDFQINNFKLGKNCFDWYDHDNIVLAEYFRKYPVNKEIVLLTDGTVVDGEKFEQTQDELSQVGILEKDRRNVKTYQIEVYKLNGTEIIEKKKTWPGRYIPLIPQYGKISKIGEHTYYKSIVTDSQDSQRIYNYAESTKTEVLALAAKDKIWMTPKQVKGFKSSIESMNTNNSPVQQFNVDPKLPGSPAQNRMGPPAVQQGLIELASDSKNNIIGLTGVSPTQQQGVMGEDVDLRSGKAMREQNIRSDTGNYIYWDNHLKSRMYEFVVLIDLIPRIYDTERQVRVLRKDGTEEIETINKTVHNYDNGAKGEKVILNDLSQGKYLADISTGKAYGTQRLEGADKMEALIEKAPMIADIGLDLLINNYDVPGADELHERVRKQMIMAGKITPTEEEQKEFGDELNKEPSEADVAQMDDLKATTYLKDSQSIELRANAKLKLSGIEKDRSITHKNIVDAYETLIKTGQLKEEQGLPATQEDQLNMLSQSRLVEDSQEDILRQPNLTEQPQ